MPDLSVASFQVFLLVLARVLAMCQIAPIINSSALPQMARIGFAFFVAAAVFPWVREAGYAVPERFLDYFLLLAGEVLVGILLGFFLVIIFGTFQVAGEFFSFQMGFGASEVYDPLAQIHVPLMGQFLNIMAMFVFLTIGGFQKFLLVGVMRSFQVLRAADLVVGREHLLGFLLGALTRLFEQALTISFPILGSLLLVSVSMGLIAKAAPQVNLLVMGFPISIAVAFIVLVLAMPLLVDAFTRVIDGAYTSLERMLAEVGGLRR